MLIVARSILTNEREGPAAGVIAMGRFLNDSAIERLADQAKIPLLDSADEGPVVDGWIGVAVISVTALWLVYLITKNTGLWLWTTILL